MKTSPFYKNNIIFRLFQDPCLFYRFCTADAQIAFFLAPSLPPRLPTLCIDVGSQAETPAKRKALSCCEWDKKRNGCERIKNKSVRGVWERCVLSARCGTYTFVDGPRAIRGLKRPGGVRQGSMPRLWRGQAAAAAPGAGAAAEYRFGCDAVPPPLERAVPAHRIGSEGASGRRDCSPAISHCSERGAVFRTSPANRCSHSNGQGACK